MLLCRFPCWPLKTSETQSLKGFSTDLWGGLNASADRQRKRDEERCRSLKFFCLPHQVLMSKSKTAEDSHSSANNQISIMTQELLWKHYILTHSSMYMNTEVPIQTFKHAATDFWNASMIINLNDYWRGKHWCRNYLVNLDAVTPSTGHLIIIYSLSCCIKHFFFHKKGSIKMSKLLYSSLENKTTITSYCIFIIFCIIFKYIILFTYYMRMFLLEYTLCPHTYLFQ